jgi:hypothetical protein
VKMRCRSTGEFSLPILAVAALLAAHATRAEELSVQSAPPVVVSTQPRAGDADVPADVKEIRVTFSRPMQNGSWSWVKVSDDSFPKMSGKPGFLEDQRTCVLPVSLEPGKTYAIWLNQAPSENFKASDGRKALPYLLVFQTRR